MTRFAAVTFDLWNTLLVEGPDGLLRPRARQWQQLLRGKVDLDLHALEEGHASALAQYQLAWARNDQFGSPDAVSAACAHLGIAIDEATRAALIRSFHDAGLASELNLVAGALDLLNALRDLGVRTAIICDIGLTPSSALTERLTDLGVLELIDVLAWSDVFGVYKPDASIFKWTLAQLGAEPSATCHVGDRLRTDVGGARASGMTTVRFRGVFDDPAPLPEADYVIDHLVDLASLLRG